MSGRVFGMPHLLPPYLLRLRRWWRHAGIVSHCMLHRRMGATPKMTQILHVWDDDGEIENLQID
jgi:hypothetical protein